MYGLVNRALEEMVTARKGEAEWERVKRDAGVEVEMFLTNDAYPDEITYALAAAASRSFGVPLDDLLEEFGIHWVTQTAGRGYGHLMASAGKTLEAFLRNLPGIHTRVGLLFPKLTPPIFRCLDERPGAMRLLYQSHRPGLAPFVKGLLTGLGQRFQTPVHVTHDVVRGPGSDHDEFLIEWKHEDVHV